MCSWPEPDYLKLLRKLVSCSCSQERERERERERQDYMYIERHIHRRLVIDLKMCTRHSAQYINVYQPQTQAFPHVLSMFT